METDMKLFDWQKYVNTYSDLKKAGINNLKKAWKHWTVHGKKEGRTCCFKQEDTPVVVEIEFKLAGI